MEELKITVLLCQLLDGTGKNTHKISVGKPGSKTTFLKLRSRWKNNIKIYLQLVKRESLDWNAQRKVK